MKKVYVLNTCDEWESYGSFRLYGIWESTKAGTNRLVNAIIYGIRNGDFAYNDEQMNAEIQIECLREDAKKCCIDILKSLQRKLKYGSIQLVDIR